MTHYDAFCQMCDAVIHVEAQQGAATGCADSALWLSVHTSGHCGLPIRFHAVSAHLKDMQMRMVLHPSDPGMCIPYDR